MYAFLSGCAAAVVIAVVAAVALDQLPGSSAETYASDNVRLSEPKAEGE
ncbi:MAG: hypothetical protein AAF495_07920 [Pseudomonadota bacterium]